jgi:Reverse transcriptase (RNA-dependent DNA polymerase)
MSNDLDSLEQEALAIKKEIKSHVKWSEITKTNKNSFKIFQLNARSMNKKIDEIKYINDKIGVADAICISETWLKADNENSQSIKNYEGIFANRTSRIGGGAAIFVKKSITYERKLCFCDEVNSIVKIKLKTNEENINLISVYRPPYSNVTLVSDFLCKFEEILKDCDGTTIITGDFNFDLIDQDANTKKYIDISTSAGFHFLYNCDVTREASKTCIDHVLINNLKKSYEVNIMPYDLLDHKIVITEIISEEKTKVVTNKHHDRTYIDYYMLKKIMQKENLTYKTTKTLDENYEKYCEVIQKAKTIATKRMKSKSHKLKEMKPWFDSEVLSALEMKQYSFNKKPKEPKNEEDLKKISEYKYWRNYVTELKRSKKQKFNESKYKCAEGDPAKQWKWIKNVMNDWEYNREECQLLKECDTHKEKTKKINDANEFLCTVGEKLAEGFSTTRIKMLHPTCSFNFSTISSHEVEKIIKKAKKSNACGPEELSMNELKAIAPHISHFLADTINTSLKNGQIPKKMKQARATLIHKSGNKSDPNNYRPICNLSMPAKCQEKFVNNQLLDYLEKEKLIDTNQYGFRQNSNTDAAIFDINNEISQAVDQGFKVAAIFLDQKKAFDTAHHKTLTTKLFNTGITGRANKWFQNYLSGREQYIKIDDIQSETRTNNSGVPQGSPLSGTCYIVYNNDMSKSIKHGKTFKFADDVALIFKAKTYVELEQYMNEDLNNIANYLDANKSTLNEKKTQFMVFRDESPPKLNIYYKGFPINPVKTATYLGIKIDHDMKWKSHIEHLRKKLAPIAGIFRRIRNDIPKKMKRSLFFSMFQSRLLYGITAWGCADCTSMDIIQKIQNRAIKNLFCYERKTPTTKIHTENRILTVKKLHQKTAATHIFKMSNGNIHTNIKLCRGSTSHKYETKKNKDLRTPKVKTKYFGTSSMNYKSITAFNMLPQNLKEEKSLERFKRVINDLMLSQI